MKNLILTAAIAAGAFAATPVLAQTTIDFEAGNPVSQYAAQGIVFNSNFSVENNTFGNAVIVPSGANYANVGSGAVISFINPTTGAATTSNGFGLTIAGLEASGGYFAGGSLSFLDAAGTQIGSQTFGTAGPNEFRSPITYFTTLPGISQVVFTRTENSNGPALFPIDDVRFDLAAGTGVPEPASWALMIGGFGMAGAAFRRRASAVRFAV